MIAMRTRLRPPIQFFQPPPHRLSVLFTFVAKFTVWAVEFQEGQQVALPTWLVHDSPQDSGQSPQNLCQEPQVAGTALRRGGRIMPHDGVWISTKLGLNFDARRSPEPERKARPSLSNRVDTSSPIASDAYHGSLDLSKAGTVSHLLSDAFQEPVHGLARGALDAGLGGNTGCDLVRSSVSKSESPRCVVAAGRSQSGPVPRA